MATPLETRMRPQEPPSTNGTPAYYAMTDGKDLYSLLEEHYGQDAFAKHLEMECMQYLWRCRAKGQYVSDIQKTIVILQRLLTLPQRPSS